jgi:hypothetical protein
MSDAGSLMRVEGALEAHFKQPSGPSLGFCLFLTVGNGKFDLKPVGGHAPEATK